MPKKSIKKRDKGLELTLQTLSLFELTQALSYCEGLVSAVQNKMGHSINMLKQASMREDLFELEGKKMMEIHNIHNDMTIAIEREMDRRMKRMLGHRYGVVSVMDIGARMDGIFKEELKKQKEKVEEMKTSNLRLE